MTVKHSLYFHIGNGGVTFAVADEGNGPLVRVSAYHHGHNTASTSLMLRREDLKALADLFTKAAQDAYSPDCIIAAEKPFDPNGPRPMGNVAAMMASATYQGEA